MSKNRKDWTYYDEQAGDWVRPHLSLEELDARYNRGDIQEHTMCVSERMARRAGPKGVTGRRLLDDFQS